MSSQLTLKREGVGIELRRGPFEIVLDGDRAGSIERHQTVELPVEAGQHTLQVNAGRYSSRREAFDVADGDAVNFRCHGPMVWPRYVASILMPNIALALKRQ